MLWSQIGNSFFLVCCFAIPLEWGQKAQYAFFFISYTLLNAIFYTANNIAYAALTSLITKNTNERVQVGSIRFMFSLATNLTVASITMKLVENFAKTKPVILITHDPWEASLAGAKLDIEK